MSKPPEHPAHPRISPSPESLRWVADCVGTNAHVLSLKRLPSELTATRAITVKDRQGQHHRLVLRRYVRGDEMALEPAGWSWRPGTDLARQEARILRLLSKVTVPTPEVIATDLKPDRCDAPALLLTRLPGHRELSPRNLRPWVTQLAAVLPAIHVVNDEAAPIAPRFRPYFDPTEAPPPTWSKRPHAWERAIETVAGPPPSEPEHFVHRDYHPGNVLWVRGRLKGVVDWLDASMGPAGIDVGHCRTNLAMLHGVDVADEFLAIYRSVVGATSDHHPYWDLVSAVDLRHDLRDDDEPTLDRVRLDEFVAAAVDRLT